MSIEAGALVIRISEEGAEQTGTKLDALDKKAKKLGTTPVKMPVQPPSSADLSLIDRQLEQMGKQIPLYKEGAKFATTKAGSLRELGQVEQQLRGIVAGSNTTLEQRIGAEKQLAALTAGAPQRINAVGSAFGALGKTLAALGIAVSIEKIVSGFAAMVTGAINAGDAMHDLAIRTGVSTETLSVLSQVAAKSGSSQESLTLGLRNLSREVEKLRGGNKEAAIAFGALGLSAEDLKGLNLDEVFLKIANAQAQFADGSGKSAVMTRLFGRAGEALIPTMQELAEGGFERARERAERLGGIIGPEFADKADKFKDNVEDMHTALLGLGIVIADKSLPWMTRMAEKLAELIANSRSWINTLLEAAGKAALLMLLGPGGPSLLDRGKPAPALTLTPVLTPEALRAQLPPRPEISLPTSAELAERARKAEEARIGRILARTQVGIPGVVGSIERMTEEDRIHQQLGLLGGPSVGVDRQGKMKGVGKAAEVYDAETEALEAKIEERQRRLGELVQGVGGVIGNALAEGFTAAFTGGNFFAAFGKALLAGIGGMLVQMGSMMLTWGLLMVANLGWLMATPFAAQALSGPAAIAVGTGLIALGAGMGAIGGGGAKGGAGGGGGGTNASPQPEQNEFAVAFDPDRKLRKRAGSVVSPSARGLGTGPMPEGRPPIVFAPTIIGPDDASAQRAIKKMMYNAERRGVVGR